MSARDEILARIGSALRDGPEAPAIPRAYRRGTAMTARQRLEQLVDRLEDYKANVAVVSTEEAGATVASLLAGTARVVVPAGLPSSYLSVLQATDDDGGAPAVLIDSPQRPLTVSELDEVDAVVTGAAVAVSETGTIILDASPDQGRRAISLVPDRHVCVITAEQIVEVLPEAVARLDPTRPQTWISGPSATSDIELERVEGVHGPRTLDVVILT